MSAPPPVVPVVSVVIPTYNRRMIVTEALQSVLDQGEDGVEILVVDDGSSDGTAAHLAALGWPLRVLSLPHGGVISRVRNAGIRQARGAFIAFLDSDDVWRPGKLRRQLEYFSVHPEIGVVYTNQFRQQGGGILPRTRFDDFPPRRRVLWRETLHGLCVQTSSVMARREVFDTVGLFNENLLLYEDADMWSRMSERYELAAIAEPLVVYRTDMDSLHIKNDERLEARMAREWLRLYEARRHGQPISEEERQGLALFRAALEAYEARLGDAPRG